MATFSVFLLLLLIVAAFLAAGIGFLIGYFVGQRTAARRAQSGFPVEPATPPTSRQV